MSFSPQVGQNSTSFFMVKNPHLGQRRTDLFTYNYTPGVLGKVLNKA